MPSVLAKSTVLSAAELTDAFDYVSQLKPALKEDCEFSFENVKECLLFLQFLWTDAKHQAHGLAMVITTIVAFRCYFIGIDFQDMAFTDYLKYDKTGGPEPMLFKIQRQGMSRDMVARKIQECKSALSYMEDFVKSPGQGRIFVAFSACYQVVADSLNHLHCFLESQQSQGGMLLLP